MPVAPTLHELYEADETAWLETMAELVAQRRFAEMDLAHLSEYLTDMAGRDRREVFSRLFVLMTHLLKWEHQAAKRTGSWRATIRVQRLELRQLLESGVLMNHAQTVWNQSYAEARKQAADETERGVDTVPAVCPWDVDALLSDD